MKKVILLILLGAFTQVGVAQEPADTTKSDGYTLGSPAPDGEDGEDGKDGNSVIVEFKLGETDTTKNLITRWFTLGLGINPVHIDGEFDIPSDEPFYENWQLRNAKSTNIDLGIVQQKLNLVDHKLNLYSGIGLDINKYMFEDNFIINTDEVNVWDSVVTIDNSIETKKNRLTATYLHIPFMLNFESSTKHYQSFRINIGGYGGLRLGSNQKIKYKDKDDNALDDKKKYKEKDSFDLETIVYGVKGEIGYGPVNLYTKVQLNDMIENQKPLRPLSIGIMVVPF